jgi:hypothetical protein
LFQHPDFIGGRGRGNDVIVVSQTDDVFHNALAAAVAVPGRRIRLSRRPLFAFDKSVRPAIVQMCARNRLFNCI